MVIGVKPPGTEAAVVDLAAMNCRGGRAGIAPELVREGEDVREEIWYVTECFLRAQHGPYSMLTLAFGVVPVLETA